MFNFLEPRSSQLTEGPLSYPLNKVSELDQWFPNYSVLPLFFKPVEFPFQKLTPKNLLIKQILKVVLL